jgi:membrane-associated phospholipid phosphatase
VKRHGGERRRGRHRRIEPLIDVRLLRCLAGPLHSGRGRLARTLAPLADDLKPWLAATPMLVAGGTRGRRAMVSGWEAVAVAALLADLVGRVVRRGRPHGSILRDRVVAGDEPSSSSFPSSHTSSAVAFAAAASAEWPPAVAVLAPLAAAVAWTRPAAGRHYPSDILAGAVVGGTATGAVTAVHRCWPRTYLVPWATSRRLRRPGRRG